MTSSLKFVQRQPRGELNSSFSSSEAAKVLSFHRSIPGYRPTELQSLKNLAGYLGIHDLFIKDESSRFGLNAFKVLGGTHCLARVIAGRLGLSEELADFNELRQEKYKQKITAMHFITATDGNHGRGIAWAAKQLGAKATVLMPKGSSEERLGNIRKLGAEADITEFNYDDTVRKAAETAKENNWILVQDTSWDGYEDIPKLIMQGYLTMAREAVDQLQGKKPTHIFLQAGVGAMAGAPSSFFRQFYQEEPPVISIVEPFAADCIFKTAEYDDGQLHAVSGDLKTIMAGLACGEPCSIGWNEIKASASFYFSISESVGAAGVRILSSPLEDDKRILAGESGAAPVGTVFELLNNPEYRLIKERMGIDESSVILCFLTEGITDNQSFKEIVWFGKYPSV